MKKKINFHVSRIWEIIYPIYAREILLGQSYEDFAALVQQDFELTPDQWEALLINYELLRDRVK
jgi:hypothetical protein